MANQINVAFNAGNLQTANVIIGDVQHTSIPSRKMFTGDRARRPGSLLSGFKSQDKIVSLIGIVVGSSLTDLDARIDALKLLLQGQDKNLDIDWNGSTRRYVATLQALKFKGRANTPFGERFQADFLVPTGYGVDLTTTVMIAGSNCTTASQSFSIGDPGGTFEMQLLTLKYTLQSFNLGGYNTVSLSNPANGMKISMSGVFAFGQQLVVDVEQQTVKLDGVLQDYLGSFPFWIPGVAGNILVEDDFTTRNNLIRVENIKKWG